MVDYTYRYHLISIHLIRLYGQCFLDVKEYKFLQDERSIR